MKGPLVRLVCWVLIVSMFVGCAPVAPNSTSQAAPPPVNLASASVPVSPADACRQAGMSIERHQAGQFIVDSVGLSSFLADPTQPATLQNAKVRLFITPPPGPGVSSGIACREWVVLVMDSNPKSPEVFVKAATRPGMTEGRLFSVPRNWLQPVPSNQLSGFEVVGLTADVMQPILPKPQDVRDGVALGVTAVFAGTLAVISVATLFTSFGIGEVDNTIDAGRAVHGLASEASAANKTEGAVRQVLSASYDRDSWIAEIDALVDGGVLKSALAPGVKASRDVEVAMNAIKASGGLERLARGASGAERIILRSAEGVEWTAEFPAQVGGMTRFTAKAAKTSSYRFPVNLFKHPDSLTFEVAWAADDTGPMMQKVLQELGELKAGQAAGLAAQTKQAKTLEEMYTALKSHAVNTEEGLRSIQQAYRELAVVAAEAPTKVSLDVAVEEIMKNTRAINEEGRANMTALAKSYAGQLYQDNAALRNEIRTTNSARAGQGKVAPAILLADKTGKQVGSVPVKVVGNVPARIPISQLSKLFADDTGRGSQFVVAPGR